MKYTKKRLLITYCAFYGERISGEYDTKKEALEHRVRVGEYEHQYAKKNLEFLPPNPQSEGTKV